MSTHEHGDAPEDTLDIVGIGIGPFNLGLAALGSSVPGLRMRFFERRQTFDWHPGMLIEGSSLQVSFLADLVTTIDPCNRFSFLSYLNRIGRLYQFAIRDCNYMSRKEYNLYCQWVVRQLPCLRFGTEVTQVTYDPASRCYEVETRSTQTSERRRVRARNVVIGVGTVPKLPACVPRAPATRICHSAAYLDRKAHALGCRSVALVGSGQSAAEIFYDLLQSKQPDTHITWLTRAERFYPMEYSDLTLEMVSPDYIDHFFSLAPEVKADVLSRQDVLYKGISFDFINRIYDLLYERSLTGNPGDVRIATNCELTSVEAGAGGLAMGFRHRELGRDFAQHADMLICATGYEYRVPGFLEPLREHIQWDAHGRFVLQRNYALACAYPGLFVQNGELHTHGFTSSDLSIGPYRNAVILNTILGREHFGAEQRIAFQDFGLPRPHPERPRPQPPRERHGGAARPSATPYRPRPVARAPGKPRLDEEW